MPRRPLRPNEISAGGVVVRRAPDGHEVCLVSDGRHWGFPKGLIERGETPEEAALREISEETGIARDALSLRATLPSSEYAYRRRDTHALVFKLVHHFLVEAPPGTGLHPDPAEITEAAWVDLAAARSRLSFRNSIAVLVAARDLLADGSHGDAP